jgi:hypothetical protein
MSLNEFISVNTHYTRSINLERDSGSIEVVSAYIPTSRALRTLSRVVDGFNTELSPRAWSLIGPYGSGKSSFSVFLSHLMSSPQNGGTDTAFKVLKKHDERLAERFESEVKDSDGYLKVLITGAPEPLSRRLLKGMAKAVEAYWTFKGPKPKVIADLHQAAKAETSSSDILELVSELQKALHKKQCKGILLVIDELGKFLEYEARHYGANDIYILQALAEHACKGDEANLFLFVMLHQSFEQYAKGLGENLKNEWSKVQGRFEEVPFLESSEQVLRVVSAAFSHRFSSDDQSLLLINTDKSISTLIEQEAVPSALTHNETVSLYASCYPLHPVSAVLLPLLCQKVAQNERTLFSYLGSHEEFGLQHMLQTKSDVGAYIYPHHIYDYFITNQPAVLGDYLTHRRWAEVVTAIERLGDAEEDQINMLKTIGLLNIIGSKGGFKASREILSLCAPNKSRASKALKSLAEKSIITYRRFNSEFRVWQGSDFDLEAALQEEINNIGQFALAEELSKTQTMQPIVARRYTIKSGSLRYFVPVFVDAKSFQRIEPMSADARMIFYLASDQDDEKIFHQDVRGYFSELDIVALNMNGAQLYESVVENLALQRVQATRQELNSDPVAKREFEDRLAAAETGLGHLLDELIDRPEQASWYHDKDELQIGNKRQMQAVLSQVLEQVYDKMPIIHNELINRDRPSTQANAARNKLLSAMQNHASEKDLGIEKFPAEKGLYRAVLRATGIHRCDEMTGQWYLSVPEMDGRKNRSNLKHAWERIEAFLDSTEHEARSFADLNADLMAPPYGVKAGLLPILYFVAYLVNQHEVAVYELRRYRPYFTDEMLDRFVRRPDEFQVQLFAYKEEHQQLLQVYADFLGLNSVVGTAEVFRQIHQRLLGLPDFSLSTEEGISREAIYIRNAFLDAGSVEKTLFEKVPEIFELAGKEDFGESLNDVFNELESAYSQLLVSQIQMIGIALKFSTSDDISKVRKKLVELMEWMSIQVREVVSLRPFVERVFDERIEDAGWLENILTFLAKKPVIRWEDSDKEIAKKSFIDIASMILRIEKSQLKESREQAGLDAVSNVYLLGCLKKNRDYVEERVSIDQDDQPTVNDVVGQIKNVIQNLDRSSRKAVLAEIVYEFLSDNKKLVGK